MNYMSTFWSKRRTTGKDRQVKKHYTQMSLQEKKQCVKLLQDTVNTHKYLEDRKSTRLNSSHPK